MPNDTIQAERLLLSIQEICAALGIGKTNFHEMDKTGRFGLLPVPFGGRRKLYSIIELRAWVEAGCPPRKIWQQRKQGAA